MSSLLIINNVDITCSMHVFCSLAIVISWLTFNIDINMAMFIVGMRYQVQIINKTTLNGVRIYIQSRYECKLSLGLMCN